MIPLKKIMVFGYALIFGLKYAKKKKYSHIIHLARKWKNGSMQISKFKKI